MMMQFESERPMVDIGQKAIFFAEHFQKIPTLFQLDYIPSQVALAKWSNMPEIEAEVSRCGYTWGVEAPGQPTKGKKLRGCYLKIMSDHD